jgi:outer membrane protein OmpA-like peptidoglycan-associated protein
MSAHLASLKYGILCSVVAAGLALPGAAFAAERVSSDAIIKALTVKKPVTRSLSAAPVVEQSKETDTKKFVDSLRNRPSRSLSSAEREQIALIAQERPKIDLEIRFDFNSANIAKSALSDIDALGKALSDPSLKGSSFVLAGHTDAVGRDEVNQDLSERRADSVKRYLVEKYKLAPETLVTAGYGRSRLKDSARPNAAENRRVEVVNVVDK